MRRLPADKIEDVLDAMELAFDRGSYPCVRSYIEDYEEAFLSAPSIASRQRYFALKLAAEPGLEHEKSFGEYSLLKLSHPVNVLFMEQGFLRIPKSNVLHAKAS